MSEENKKSITVFKSPSWGILGSAFLIMLGAKCFGFYPELSWLAVTCPLWGPFAICAGLFALFYTVAIAAFLVILIVATISVTLEAIADFIENLFRRK